MTEDYARRTQCHAPCLTPRRSSLRQVHAIATVLRPLRTLGPVGAACAVRVFRLCGKRAQARRIERPLRVRPGEHVFFARQDGPAKGAMNGTLTLLFWKRKRAAALADGLPPRQRVGERPAVHVLELAADRHAVRDA